MSEAFVFSDTCAIADCAAEVFAYHRTSKKSEFSSSWSRGIQRASAVQTLRKLWKTGDYSQRSTVAARVRIWMERPKDGTVEKIFAREKARIA
jgi:hypothetical protein